MVKTEIADYMEKVFLLKFGGEITDSTDLFKTGVMDSFGYVQLMHYLQNTYRIRFSKEELLSNVITSLSGIVSLVESKLERPSGGRRDLLASRQDRDRVQVAGNSEEA